MNDHLDKFFEPAKNVHLEKEHSDLLRANLFAHMKANPVRGRTFFDSMTKLVPAGMLLFVLIGGGIAAAAENTLPGDVLYAIKTQINEKVISAFQVSTVAETHWEIKLSERRLQEAEAIAADPKVSTEAKAQVQQDFQKHAERVRETVANLQAEGNTEAVVDLSTRFEASLETHTQVLENLSASPAIQEASKTEIDNLQRNVEERIAETVEVRQEAQSSSGSIEPKPSIDNN